jgi:hypothetical protein
MSNSNLTISLNEILFFFTRAGFGVDAPVGIAEDFARSNIWIAQNGFDPSLCSIKALNNLDNSESSLAINFEKNSTYSRLYCSEDKLLSALEASVSCVDWIEVNGSDSELRITNVDSPLLVVSAIGASEYVGLKVVWVDQDKSQYQVNFIDNMNWEIISSSSNPIESSSVADMTISSLDSNQALLKDSNIVKFNLPNEKKKILENGVQVKESWEGIYEYFSRCLVKSNAESRASGAGAGMVDTD